MESTHTLYSSTSVVYLNGIEMLLLVSMLQVIHMITMIHLHQRLHALTLKIPISQMLYTD